MANFPFRMTMPQALLALMAIALVANNAVAATPLHPQHDDDVLEVLPSITRHRVAVRPRPKHADAQQHAQADAQATQALAQQAITLARQTGDTRHWGRAQALLTPWWNRADAPVELAVLQATVQQGRHEFEASRKVLAAALARQPGYAQGWLNLAALERLSARYKESLLACAKVARAGQVLYAQACEFETQSLLGQHGPALRGIAQLAKQSVDSSQQSWLLSLQAETHERAGQDRAALAAYEQSLARQPDLYTAIALSDLLLRTGDFSKALAVLSPLPQTDAVVLRQGIAWRRLGDPRWRETLATFMERVAELKRRGDDPELHGRELAMSALWLQDDAAGALALARKNLLLQREPMDWWLALQSARAAGNSNAMLELATQWTHTGLKDARLEARAAAGTAMVSRVAP